MEQIGTCNIWIGQKGSASCTSNVGAGVGQVEAHQIHGIGRQLVVAHCRGRVCGQGNLHFFNPSFDYIPMSLGTGSLQPKTRSCLMNMYGVK